MVSLVFLNSYTVTNENSPIEIIRQKGLEKINLEDLVEELLPKGRSLVPTKVKEDLLGQIKVFLENDQDYKKLSGF